MSAAVFNNDVTGTPANVPTWSVQSPATGSDQHTVASVGATGTMGPTGPAGPAGPAGADGAPGANGTTPGLADLGALLTAAGVTSASDLPALFAALGIV